MPLVSIALSTCNGERFLREQIDSVLAQEGVDIELVCIDDDSRDGTCSILTAYAAADSRVRWSANEANLGPTATFERAMAQCRGEYIAPCDQDDYWEPHKLRRLLDAIGDADLAYSDSAYIDAQGRDLGVRLSDNAHMLEGNEPANFFFANSVSGHASLVRRSLFDAARPFPVGAYHDWWLALCAAGRGGVRYLPEPLVRFRRHGNAFSAMGAEHMGKGTAAAGNDWLQIRRSLLQAYGCQGLAGADAARALSSSIDQALAGGAMTAFKRSLRSLPAAVPRWTGQPQLDALRLSTRIARKIRRARSPT